MSELFGLFACEPTYRYSYFSFSRSIYLFWKFIVQCFQATSTLSQEWYQSRLVENRPMLVVKWTFDELYFLSSSLFLLLLLLSIVISYVPFMAVIRRIKVYIYNKYYLDDRLIDFHAINDVSCCWKTCFYLLSNFLYSTGRPPNVVRPGVTSPYTYLSTSLGALITR